MKLTPRIGNTSNIELYGVQIKRDQTVTIRVYMENGDADDVYLCATRADFVEQKRTGEADDTARANGQELLSAGAILAKVGAGAWTNICGWSNKLQIGPLNEQAYIDVQLKSDLTNAPLSTGTVQAGLAFRIAGTEADDTFLDPSSGAGTITVSGCGYTALNQDYIYHSPGVWVASNNALIRLISGYWYLEAPISNDRTYFSYYQNSGNIPSRGWQDTRRSGRLLPNPILTQGA